MGSKRPGPSKKKLFSHGLFIPPRHWCPLLTLAGRLLSSRICKINCLWVAEYPKYRTDSTAWHQNCEVWPSTSLALTVAFCLNTRLRYSLALELWVLSVDILRADSGLCPSTGLMIQPGIRPVRSDRRCSKDWRWTLLRVPDWRHSMALIEKKGGGGEREEETEYVYPPPPPFFTFFPVCVCGGGCSLYYLLFCFVFLVKFFLILCVLVRSAIQCTEVWRYNWKLFVGGSLPLPVFVHTDISLFFSG